MGLRTLLALAALALATGCARDAEPPSNPVDEAGEVAGSAADRPGASGATDAPPDTPVELVPDPMPPPVVEPDDEAEPPPPVVVRGPVGSCDVRESESVCMAFTGLGWTTAAAQAECAEAPGGVFLSATCPTSDRIGECVYRPDGDVTREIVSTFYAPMEPLIAEAVCRGTFRPR